MAPKTITVRELHQRLPMIAKRVGRGQRYIVTRYAKTLFRIEPPEDVHRKNLYTLEDIAQLHFKGSTTLSRDIDKILYGA